MKLTYSQPELAEVLGMSARRLAERRAALQALGFPAPVPGMGLRWSVAAVTAYVNQQCGGSSLPPGGTTGGGSAGAVPSPPPVAALQRRIAEKYGAGA